MLEHLSPNSYYLLLQTHYYQPLFTLVGGGLADLQESMKSTDSIIPKGCTFLKDEVKEFEPEQNYLTTGAGHQVLYFTTIVYLDICYTEQLLSNYDRPLRE